MTIRAVLFDLDGTLVDSLEDLTDAVNHMRGTFLLPPQTSNEVRMMVGKGAGSLVRKSLAGRSEDDVKLGLQLFFDYNAAHIADKSRLYLDALNMLDSLQAIGIRMAVITNKNESLSNLLLKELGIHHYFETICGGNTFAEMKPSPLPLLNVITRLEVAPHEALMVGDSINDIEAGRQAGIATIGCSWGFADSPELDGSDYMANSCNDLFATIKGLIVKTA